MPPEVRYKLDGDAKGLTGALVVKGITNVGNTCYMGSFL